MDAVLRVLRETSIDGPYGWPEDNGANVVALHSQDFEVLTARELCALPDPPAEDNLIGDLVVRGNRTVIGGERARARRR